MSIPLLATEITPGGLLALPPWITAGPTDFLDNCDWLEVLAFNRAGEPSLDHFGYGLTEPFTVDADGYVHAPTGPGLGVGIDWPLINSNVSGVVS